MNKDCDFLSEYLNLVAIFEEDLIRSGAVVGEIKLRELVLERVERDELFEVGRDRQQPPEFRLERGDEAVEGGNELGLKQNKKTVKSALYVAFSLPRNTNLIVEGRIAYRQPPNKLA